MAEPYAGEKKDMSEVDFLVKLRDGATIIADACQERLEKLSPIGPQESKENLDFSSLTWEKKTGTKGEFEQTSDKANNNSELWQQLQTKMKEHKGFWQYRGFKYWFDRQQESVVDRRKIG